MRTITGGLAAVALVALVVMTGVRFVRTDVQWVVLLASFSSYALLGYLVVLVVCALLLRRAEHPLLPALGVTVALLGVLAHAWWMAPLFVGGHDGEPGRSDLTVMTSNLRFGRGDVVTVARTVASEQVDILVLVECTPAALDRAVKAGIGELLPYLRGQAVEGASGTVVFSRYPLEDERAPFTISNTGVDLRVDAPQPFRLLALHNGTPLISTPAWNRDLRSVRDHAIAALADGPTVVVGDLNADRDHAQLRTVLGLGLRDAAEQANSGWQPTWPTSYRRTWLRPLIAIDHVLSSEQYVAVETHTVPVADSDHLALVARLQGGQG